jgi:molybdopterin-guanine dinucleotide biosynthesis protein A
MNAAGIILAGGKSSRFQGNKAFVELESQRIIDRIVFTLREVFPKVILVANTPEEYENLGVEIVSDLIPGQGPLGGIHSGLLASPFDLNFIVACDMPFVRGDLGAYLVSRAAPEDDAVVPVINGYPEPLCAVYRKSCIPAIESRLEAGIRKVTSVYPLVRVCYVPEEDLAVFGGAETFFNVNTREDLKRVLQKFRSR